MRLLLDTHIWIWLMEGDKKLSGANRESIEKTGFGNVCISAISVWEIAMLVKYGKLVLDRSPRAWVENSVKKLGIDIIPMDMDIALECYALPGDLHNDPADRTIVATARQCGLTLVTQDKAIVAYGKKGHLRIA